jgi:hypothetical protein
MVSVVKNITVKTIKTKLKQQKQQNALYNLNRKK